MKLTQQQARALGIIGASPRQRAWNGTGPKARGKRSPRPRDAVFDALCLSHGLSLPEPEFHFALPRKWRADYCFAGWLLLEVQGGIWTQGRHVRGAALLDEYEKLNAAVCLGYGVLFCTPQQIKDGSIFPVIKRALDAREARS